MHDRPQSTTPDLDPQRPAHHVEDAYARPGVIVGNHNETVTGATPVSPERPAEPERMGVIVSNHNETLLEAPARDAADVRRA
jgi:hypothetical protein